MKNLKEWQKWVLSTLIVVTMPIWIIPAVLISFVGATVNLTYTILFDE